MTEQTVSVGLTSEVRTALLGESDISTAARAALELPGGGQPTSHFEATFTQPVAEELMAKCRQIGFRQAAQDIQAQLLVLKIKNRPT